MFKAIDLFAGIGGIRLGFEQAIPDMETVFVSELDKQCKLTYKDNFNDNVLISGDITQIQAGDIPVFDICLAGFPCQAFSIAGSRLGFADNYKGLTRGTLFFDVARICDYHKPKVIFCENVKGLAIHDKGNTLNVIINTLTGLGYTVYYNILNSLDYGVPQRRERVYIVAFRDDIDSTRFKWPEPNPNQAKIKDIMEPHAVDAKYYMGASYLETLRKHRKHHEEHGNGFGYEVRDTNSFANTIVIGGMGHERNLIVDDKQTNFSNTVKKGGVNTEYIRKMTPREWARLQGFPDTYKFNQSDTAVYKQVANSVTIPVIKAIASQIYTTLAAVSDS